MHAMTESRDEIRDEIRRKLRLKLKVKNKVRAILRRHDGTVLEGRIFVGMDERTLDVMNADESFLPFLTAEERFILINKSSIAQIEPFDEERRIADEAAGETPSLPVPSDPTGITGGQQDVEPRTRSVA